MIPTGWACPRRIGFLFPHPCERPSPAGCLDCQNGLIQDPYRQRREHYGYDDSDDFTEADGITLVKPREEFEDDLSAS